MHGEAMKTRLNTTLSQQLALTPQLQQALRLLQMSATELEQEVAQAVASNPLLEWAEEAPPRSSEPGPDSAAPAPASPSGEDAGNDAGSNDWMPDQGPWAIGSTHDDEREPPALRLTGEGQDLTEHLRWQLRFFGGYAPEKVEIPQRFRKVVTWRGPIDNVYMDELMAVYGRKLRELSGM